MCNLGCDIDDGTISEEEAEQFQGDDDMYLDRFPDPFERPSRQF